MITATHHQGKFFFSGGATKGTTLTNVVDIWDGSTWETTNMVKARCGAFPAAIGDNLYFVGGGGANLAELVYTSADYSIDVYNTRSGQWSTLEMGIQRINHTVAVHNNKLYAIGGTDFTGIIDLIEIYEPTASEHRLTVDEGIRISPNPSSNTIHVQISREDVGAPIRIFNAKGQLMMDLAATSKTISIDIDDLNPGVYFISTPMLKERFIKH